MTDRPILFSSPMVRALLAGTKTQTRRVAKVAAGVTLADISEWVDEPNGFRRAVFRRDQFAEPRFAVGDRLFVREAWRAQEEFDALSPKEIGQQFKDETGEAWCPTSYEADQRCDGSSIEIWQQSPPGKLRPGIHMPRWASRLTLTVTDLRVQRLQEISEADAIAEGIVPLPSGRFHCGYDDEGEIICKSPITAYAWLWNSINEDRAPWSSNPWVVAVSFTVERRNIDEALP